MLCVRGNCLNIVGNFSCFCEKGWIGEKCEMEINECNFYFCKNNGMCMDFDGFYNCICLIGIMGNNCEMNIDECVVL